MDTNKLVMLNEDTLLEEYIEEGKIIDAIKSGVAKVDQVAKSIIIGVKNLHKTDDDYLVSGIPQLSKLIGRTLLVAGATAIPTVGPILGLITLYTSHATKSKFDEEAKKKLYNVYLQKLKAVDEKIDSVKSSDSEDKEKEIDALSKIRDKLKHDAQSLKVLKMDELDRKES